MKIKLNLLFICCMVLLWSCSGHRKSPVSTFDLQEQWDTIRPLENPHKGWYHHMLDNGIHKYLVQDEKDISEFPGMDHLYLRLCWAFLEPEEGKFDWSYIDDIVEKYVPLGYHISFRISCKETGPAPTSVPKEVDGVRYATPYWVKQAGARGEVPDEFGSPSWTPDWLDPVYLEKLDNFHRAFATKYDGQPWVRYIDVGSIGEWGEGHTHFSTRIPPTVEDVKTHMDLYLKHYKETQLVVTDDLLYWNKEEEDVQALFNYAKEKGFSLRDDSPMVAYYVENMLDSWTVSHAQFFEEVFPHRPTILEMEHYNAVKESGYWLGENGMDTIPGLGVSGARIIKEAMKLIRPTYIGFHGYLGEWLPENPDLTKELLNLSGYWYFPKEVEILKATKYAFSFRINWLNRGVAPAYHPYSLRVSLQDIKTPENIILHEFEYSGNQGWMPGEFKDQMYSLSFDEPQAGKYSFHIQLFDHLSQEAVDMGLKEVLKKSDGYYEIGQLELY